MAANLLKQAAQSIRRSNESSKIQKVEQKAETGQLMTYGGALLGSGGAALIDAKWGSEWGDKQGSADIKGIPVNAVAGVLLLGGAMWAKKLPGRNFVGGVGLGAACASFYKFVVDKAVFEKDEDAAA